MKGGWVGYFSMVPDYRLTAEQWLCDGSVVVMLGAIFLVHLPHGFNVGGGGAEYALTQLLVAIAFLLTGPGAYSLGSLLPASLQKL